MKGKPYAYFLGCTVTVHFVSLNPRCYGNFSTIWFSINYIVAVNFEFGVRGALVRLEQKYTDDLSTC